MKLTSLLASTALAACAASVSLSTACGGNESSTSAPNSAADYCSALSNYVSTCKITDACSVASAQTCTQYVSAFSPAALGTFTSCTSSLACGDAGTQSASLCIAAGEASITPSAAQQTLAKNYCAACASAFQQTAADCAETFYAQLTTANTNEAGLSTSSADIGSAFLDLNDTLITSVDTSCVGGVGADAGTLGCTVSFELCAGALIQKAVKTPVACQSQTPGAQ